MGSEKKRLGPVDLGLEMGRGTDAPAFRWLVACQLFGARISQDIAARAYRELDDLGVLTPAKLADADWQMLVDALGRGGYRRYDESTARELITLGQQVRDDHGGHLTRLRRAVDSRRELADKVRQFKGIGPTAADIFVRELARFGTCERSNHGFGEAQRRRSFVGIDAWVLRIGPSLGPFSGGAQMTTTSEQTTGTSDQEYNVIWFTQACLKNAQRLETYIKDAQRAGNEELMEFFRKAQAESRKGAELGKEMLRTLLDADR